MNRTLRAYTIACLISLSAAMVSLWSTRGTSWTIDEPGHLRYGSQILSGDARRFDDSKMPVTAVNALGAPSRPLARAPTSVFFALLCLGVFAWARGWYGPAAGWAALWLCACAPNLLAHARWATNDLYMAGFSCAALWTLHDFLRRGGMRRLVFAALALGLALLSKYSALLLLPVVVVLSLGMRGKDMFAAPRKAALYVAGYAAVSLAVLNAGFLFGKTAWVPFPVPAAYLEGLRLLHSYNASGLHCPNTYFWGQLHGVGQWGGFPLYYGVALALKEPLAAHILFAAALCAYARRATWRGFWAQEAFLLVPAAAFLLAFSLFVNNQTGIRYVLVVLPLGYVYIAGMWADWPRWRLRARLVTAALLGWFAVSSFSYYPYFTAHFNELIGNRLNAYRYLSDSNLHWGEHQRLLDAYLRAHPGAVYNPAAPVTGEVVVDTHYLTGISNFEAPGGFAHYAQLWWLRQKCRPCGHIGYGYLIYRVTPEDLAR